MTSICQVGIALYEQETLIEEWRSYIDPEDDFDEINVSIHGIDETTVEGAPRLPDVCSTIHRLLDDRVAVCHTHFDRVAVKQAFDWHDLRHPRCEWLDSARVARRAWEEFACRGYGLANVCAFLGYEFGHHDALEDAKAAAYILNAAMRKTALDVERWLQRVRQPISGPRTGAKRDPTRDGNPEGHLFGEVLVFTGTLRIPRDQAGDLAAELGCRVTAGVSKKTTMLVVGDQDVRKLAGHEKSSKHRKAEALIAKGLQIRILRETDFEQLAKLAK